MSRKFALDALGFCGLLAGLCVGLNGPPMAWASPGESCDVTCKDAPYIQPAPSTSCWKFDPADCTACISAGKGHCTYLSTVVDPNNCQQQTGKTTDWFIFNAPCNTACSSVPVKGGYVEGTAAAGMFTMIQQPTWWKCK